MRKSPCFTLVLVGLAAALAGFSSLSAQAPTELPWTVDDLKQALVPGTTMAYSVSGTDDRGEEVGGTYSFEVTKATDWSVEYEAVQKEGGSTQTSMKSSRWEDAQFLATQPDAEFEIVGTEEVETPAGTFETVVVKARAEIVGKWRRQTYWMIPDQPGVYAKFVDHGKDGREKNLVMVLEEVTRPGS